MTVTTLPTNRAPKTEAAPPVHVAIARVMADMPAVGKNGWNNHSKYKYRSIDDLITALSGVMARHGVYVLPRVRERLAAQNGKSVYVTVHVDYKITGPGGDYEEASFYGEGADVGDKATAKALTNAFKYLMIQLFMIPVQDLVDGDRDTPRRAVATTPPVADGSDDRALQAQDIAHRATEADDPDALTELCKTAEVNGLLGHDVEIRGDRGTLGAYLDYLTS
ncbi:ERF family protein [Streptomyces roseifaciens]